MEQLLWKAVFYRPIEEFRQGCRSPSRARLGSLEARPAPKCLHFTIGAWPPLCTLKLHARCPPLHVLRCHHCLVSKTANQPCLPPFPPACRRRIKQAEGELKAKVGAAQSYTSGAGAPCRAGSGGAHMQS